MKKLLRVYYVVSGKWIGDREYHTFSVVVAVSGEEDAEAVACRVAHSKPVAKLWSTTAGKDAAEHHRTRGNLYAFDVEEIHESTDASEPVLVWEHIAARLPQPPGPPSSMRDRGIIDGTPSWKARYYP